jgi:FMN reductase
LDTPIHVVAVVASQAGGNTDRLVGQVLQAASDAQAGVTVATVHLGAGPLDPARVEGYMQRLAGADAVVLGTPMYRSTYAAVLKELLERVPRGGPSERFEGPLRAKAVGIVATGGSHHHFLGADPLIDLLVRYFGAYVVPPVLYGVIRSSGGDASMDPGLVEDAVRFGRALVALGQAIKSDDRLRGARAQI